MKNGLLRFLREGSHSLGRVFTGTTVAVVLATVGLTGLTSPATAAPAHGVFTASLTPKTFTITTNILVLQ